MTLKPQFDFDRLYITPFTRRRGFDEEKMQVIWLPLDVDPRPTGIDILDTVRDELRQYRNPSRLCRRWGISTADLGHLLRLLTGMDTRQLYMAWRARQTDELLRYTDISLADLARRLRFQSTMALNVFVNNYSGQSPTARRRTLRQSGDLNRYGL